MAGFLRNAHVVPIQRIILAQCIQITPIIIIIIIKLNTETCKIHT